MISGLKPYPDYKDSGEPWLGAVPAHWELRRTKTLLQERSEKGFPDEPLLAATQTKGVVRKEQYENRTVLALKDLHLLKLVRVYDFVISLRSFQGGIEYAREQGIISPAYTILYPVDHRIHPYLARLYKSQPYIENLSLFVTGIRQGQNVDYERLSRSQLPVPPLSEQLGIARFLDQVDKRIRPLLRAKRQQIALLNEQKQAVIRQAVTGGLYPDVPSKPSGVEWLGSVPSHWTLTRVKHLTRIVRGRFAHRPRNDPSLYDGPYPFIQTGEVSRARMSITTYRQTLNERGRAVSMLFPAGTLVMTIAANIGDVAVLDFDACFPDSVVGFVPQPGVVRDYLYYVFLAMKPELLLEAPVSTQGNLNIERIGSRKIAVPPLHEQAEIVGRIDKATLGINQTVSRTQSQMDLLREYRTRLIADVVTGKLDVREAAANLPDESEPPEAEELDTEDESEDPEEETQEPEEA